MTFDGLLSEIRKIKAEETRAQKPDYLEIVVSVSELPAVTDVLKAYFGQPFKPEGRPPSPEADRLAAPFGGIFEGQTMYLLKRDGGADLVFLWPWGSGASVTVKAIHQ